MATLPENDLYAPRLRFSSRVRQALRETDAPVVVTGASGWIGLVTLEMLADALGTDFERRVVAIASKSRMIALRDGFAVRLTTLAECATRPLQPGPLVAHYAFLTREKAADRTLESYVEANRAIIRDVGDFCRAHRAAGLVETSSGAVFSRMRLRLVASVRSPWYRNSRPPASCGSR